MKYERSGKKVMNIKAKENEQKKKETVQCKYKQNRVNRLVSNKHTIFPFFPFLYSPSLQLLCGILV